jgi:uncharacterized protein YjiS (DUF1127 family)
MEVIMTISNTSAAFIRSDRVLYWRQVKRSMRELSERARSRHEVGTLSDDRVREEGLSHGEAEFKASKPFWTA